MIYKKEIITIHPDDYERVTQFFHKYELPLHLGHGARLIGRYKTEESNEVTCLWEYDSHEEFHNIQEKIKQSDLYRKAMKERDDIEQLFLEVKVEMLEKTGDYHFPKYIVSVSAFVTNDAGEVLLVKNEHREDTYEMPGGRVEYGESLITAVKREVIEETGVEVEIDGVTGVYHNISRDIVCIVFKGYQKSGVPRPLPGETKEVLFKDVKAIDLSKWVTRDQFRVRIFDAMQKEAGPVESYHVRPYGIVDRLPK